MSGQPELAGVAEMVLKSEAARLVRKSGRHELERRYGDCWTCDAIRLLRMVAGIGEDNDAD